MKLGNSKLLIFALISLIAIISVPAGAYELTPRSFGMGGAFSAIADDIEAVLYNPASVANAGVIGLNFSTGISAYNIEFLEELRDLDGKNNYEDILHIVGKIKGDTGSTGQLFLGARLSSLGLAYNMENEFYLDHAENRYTSEKISEGIFTYANKLLEPPFEIGALYYGINLKYIDVDRSTYDIEENLKSTAQGSGFGIDLGALAKITDNLRVACVLENALASDLKLEGEVREYQYIDKSWDSRVIDSSYTSRKEIESKIRIGAAFRVPVIDLTLAADIDNFLADKSEQVLHLGLEKNLLFSALSLRAGKVTGEEVDLNTLGLGVNLTGFNLDIAFGKNNTDRGSDELIALLSASMDF